MTSRFIRGRFLELKCYSINVFFPDYLNVDVSI